MSDTTDAVMAIADVEQADLRAEVDRLAHLLGAFADDRHRCSCTMIDPGVYHGYNMHPPEWEQDPWCPVHPDVDQIRQEFDRAKATVERVRALFNGGPDTSCRTVWDGETECVSVPLADISAALDGLGQ